MKAHNNAFEKSGKKEQRAKLNNSNTSVTSSIQKTKADTESTAEPSTSLNKKRSSSNNLKSENNQIKASSLVKHESSKENRAVADDNQNKQIVSFNLFVFVCSF